MGVDLGGETVGSAGQPTLTCAGTLTAGSILTLDLVDAAPLELALAPSGLGLWFQVGIQGLTVPVYDASVINGVKGSVP